MSTDALRSPILAPESKPTRVGALLSRPLAVTLLGAIATVIFGVGDFVTRIELPFTILYLLPIGACAWFGSRRVGLGLSMLATVCIGCSLVHEGLTPLVIAWNLIGAALLFCAASWAIDRIHSFVERERALRRMAVEQLRHAERLNVIGTLAAGVAHELGTPLNVIGGCAEFLAEEFPEPKVHKRTQMILDQVTKVSSIIRRLLDFGHRGPPTRERIDLLKVAEGATEMLRSTARKRGTSIVIEGAAPVHVSGDAAELEQVLSNLILNGLHAMTKGTIHVRVGVTQRNSDPVACVEVLDEGCGIPPENLRHIFDPFFTTKGVGEGTGLGLSVSYGIVRDHDGAIEASSEPGKGSRFTVLLPLRD